MNTTPKTPLKHAATILAWSNDAAIQYRKDETTQWTDASYPLWHEDYEYRVKPAASVYPETRMTPDQITDLWRSARTNPWDQAVMLFANQIIARAIDDGEVVRVDAAANKAFDKRLELAEAVLLAAGYERVDVEGNWKHKSASYSVKIDTNGHISGTAMKLGLSDTSFSSALPKEPDELARRACRALCEYLGKSRDDVSFEVIQAIILLERNKL